MTFKDTHIKFLSLNVRGLRSSFKRAKVFSWLEEKQADVIFLQETFSSPDIVSTWASEWNGELFFSHGSVHSGGVMIMIKRNVEYSTVSRTISEDGRYLILKIVIDGNEFILCNVYAPTADKRTEQRIFFENLVTTLHSFENIDAVPMIMGGDFNVLMNANLDRQGGHPHISRMIADVMNEMQSDFDLIDIWRVRNPTVQRFTWKQLLPLIQSRLDIWFISDHLQDYIPNVDIIPGVSSDHSAIVLEFKVHSRRKVNAFNWKFNNDLCNDETFCSIMSENIDKWTNESTQFEDIRMRWEYLKYQIRVFSRQYSIDKAKSARMKRAELEKKLQYLEGLLEKEGDVHTAEYERVKYEYEAYLDYVTQGIIIRSRANWTEFGEKNTKYFLNLEKVHKSRSSIVRLQYGNDVISDEKNVNDHIKEFYTELYRKPEVNSSLNHMFLEQEYQPKLSASSKQKCDLSLSLKECTRSLFSMAKNKSPGNDGLTVEFYNKFWKQIGPLLVDTLNFSFENGQLSTSQRQGLITLIAKKGKDKLLIENYRPITLLNVDLKIGSKALAERLKLVLPDLIHPDQVAFLKNRYIGESVRTILDALYYSRLKNIPGILLSLDFQKAFDSLDHSFLLHTLRSFNFGDKFCNFIKVLYTNLESCVMNRGISSGYFPVERGVRQGDPLSAYLFILAIETLAINLRNNSQIEGLKINNDDEIKLSLYADDMNVFLKDEQSVNFLFDTLEKFRQVSSLTINLQKTNAMRIGSDRYNNLPLENIQVVNTLTVLGVDVSYSPDVLDSQLKRILMKIKRQLNLWKVRNLSLIGKIQIVKTFAFSQLLYIAGMVKIPDSYIKEVNRLVYGFIWNGPDRIKREVMVKEYEEGGFKMLCLKSLLQVQKIKWVNRIFTSQSRGWRAILLELLKDIGGVFLFHCNFDVKYMKVNLNEWYKEIIQVWNYIFHKDISIANQVIWNNKFILLDGKTIFKSSIVSKGIVKIAHMLDEHGRPIIWKDAKERGLSFVEYFTLLDCYKKMPSAWKQYFLQQNFHALMTPLGSIPTVIIDGIVKNSVDVSKAQIYSICKQMNNPSISSTFVRLNEMYKFADAIIIKILKLPFTLTIDTKLRVFQLKVVHNLIPTKVWLCRIHRIANATCCFCNNGDENLEHLFVSCKVIEKFWLEISTIFAGLGFHSILSKENILFGLTEHAKSRDVFVINFLLLLGKQYIFRCRNLENAPSVRHFLNYVKYFHTIEKYIAERRNKIETHETKWGFILEILENHTF